MLLAAGEGTRLRPLTLETPKPLLEVAGKTLIETHIEGLVRAGVTEVVINLHHLAERIREFAGDGARWGVTIRYSVEPELLETGGGVARALPLLGPDPFVVVSADICTDYDFAALVRPLPEGVVGHLVMVDNPPHHPAGDFAFAEEAGAGMRYLEDTGEPRYNYGGIALVSPALFAGHPVARYPLRPLLDRAIEERRLTGEHFTGFWINIGTAEQLEEARRTRSAP